MMNENLKCKECHIHKQTDRRIATAPTYREASL